MSTLLRFSGLAKGMLGGFSPVLIPEGAYARGVNTTIRGGMVSTRPGFTDTQLTFESERDRNVFEQGRWQGGSIFRGIEGDQYVCAVAGEIFVINLDTLAVENRSALVGRMSRYVPRCFFCQAESTMVVQDGLDAALLLTRSGGRRADPLKNEVPVGTRMAYGYGRLFVQRGERAVLGGDVYRTGDPDSCLRFTEWFQLNGGYHIGLQDTFGPITGMAFMPLVDSSMGIGPLLIGSARGIRTFHVELPRATWFSSGGFSTVMVADQGFASHEGIAIANGDLWYRSPDGIRSLVLNRGMNNAPITVNHGSDLAPFLDEETDWAIDQAEAVIHDGRLFCTAIARQALAYVSPTKASETAVDRYHAGLYVLDLIPIGGLSVRQPPAWDGLWTGMNPISLAQGRVQGRERLLVIGKRNRNRNTLWLLDEARKGLDRDAAGEDVPVPARLYLPRLEGQDPWKAKRITGGRFHLTGISGAATFGGYVRPMGADFWVRWCAGRKINARLTDGAIACERVLREQERPFFCLGALAPAQSSVPGGSTAAAWAFDVCLDWSGPLTIERGLIECDEGNAVAANLQAEPMHVWQPGQDLVDTTWSVGDAIQ